MLISNATARTTIIVTNMNVRELFGILPALVTLSGDVCCVVDPLVAVPIVAVPAVAVPIYRNKNIHDNLLMCYSTFMSGHCQNG